MGKIFPLITTLKEKPSCFEKTLKLIEKSFKYPAHQSFAVDFAPLMHENNHHNCYILIDENEDVLAHIGVKERMVRVRDKNFTICMIGGIAVHEGHRGKGHFQKLIQDVLAEKRSDTTFFLLWSDQKDLYAKYGFALCGGQYELSPIKGENTFKQTTLEELNKSQKEEIKLLYQDSFCSTYLTLMRSEEDWHELALISSANLFVEENDGRIVSYFFMNKGQDLEGIVYEYGSSTRDLPSLLNAARTAGKVWTGGPFIDHDQEQYQFMLASGDLGLFTSFIHAYTSGIITIRNINVMKEEVFFDFNGETLVLSTDEFLRGMMGPGPFEELGEVKPFYLSGLDSI